MLQYIVWTDMFWISNDQKANKCKHALNISKLLEENTTLYTKIYYQETTCED